MNKPEWAVRFANLGYAYDPASWVFRDYSGEFAQGQVAAILGPNGCGKSTLLKLILGTIRPMVGSLETRGTLAFVPQLFRVSFDYTVLEMVLMGRARHVGVFGRPTRSDRQAALAALDRFHLADFAEHQFAHLSGGQRQLALLARSLVADAKLLVLDEPASSLDLKNQELLLHWIIRLSREDGLTVIMSTHHPQHALSVADSVILMLGPNRFFFGPTAEVTEANLEDLYGMPLRRIDYVHAGHAFQTVVPVMHIDDVETLERKPAGDS